MYTEVIDMENATAKKVMLSGIQPSGDLHLGNYLGAVKNWAALAEEFDCYYFMADLHSITVRQNPAELRRRSDGPSVPQSVPVPGCPDGQSRWVREPSG